MNLLKSPTVSALLFCIFFFTIGCKNDSDPKSESVKTTDTAESKHQPSSEISNSLEGELSLGPEVHEVKTKEGMVMLVQNPEIFNKPEILSGKEIKKFQVLLKGTQLQTNNYLAALFPFSYKVSSVIQIKAIASKPVLPIRLLKEKQHVISDTLLTGATNAHLFEVLKDKSKISLKLSGDPSIHFSVFKRGKPYAEDIREWEATFNEASLFTIRVFAIGQNKSLPYLLTVSESTGK